MFAIAANDRLAPFSIVAISDAQHAEPTWRTMFGWPAHDPETIPVATRSRAERKIFAARVDQAVCAAQRPVLLVADGLGCAASAWWGRLSPSDYVARIAGALLFAPRGAELTRDGEADLFASPAAPLPFPSVVIRPSDHAAEVGAAIEGWGSRLVAGHRPRHVTRDTGAWRHAQRLFLRMTHQIAAHEVDRAEALIGR
ncbi:putative alpha/beta hydrolase family esterase [Sphingomonas sp. BE138]|uniref:alpha/beta hydrolase n=1 Tax=Sphingomonas sp. BE138 TaxID=2817845 RepID=UPI002855E164|nr:alpha/beta hydrolase [Sphingomonas sp. BE138]MDR6787438.1 putative alpha/beta hydrolase family esterase [Sphingomonas sp. BE138]